MRSDGTPTIRFSSSQRVANEAVEVEDPCSEKFRALTHHYTPSRLKTRRQVQSAYFCDVNVFIMCLVWALISVGISSTLS